MSDTVWVDDDGNPCAPPHRCRIDTTVAVGHYYVGHPGYVAICDVCGQVGQPQDEARDAQAIANRHEEVGGFER